ncbi:MAG: CvpA family protein [Chloroflexi bacterium]|nr:CvpA family protein [Chloroflexota bacterium]
MIDLNQLYLIIGLVILFGLMGLRRGVFRELLALGGVFLAMVVGRWGTSFLEPWVNRFYKLGMFALKGGLVAEDPASIFAKVKELPPLVSTDSDRLMLGTGAFALVVLAFYLLGEFVVDPPETMSQRLSGVILAGANGYFMAYFLAPRHLPTPQTTIRFSTEGLVALLTQNLIKVVLAFVIILIGLGLQMSTRPKGDSRER